MNTAEHMLLVNMLLLRTYLTQQLSQIRFNSQSNSESIYSVAEVFEAQNISNENSK